MPSATEDLRNKFPGDDREALEVIDENFIVDSSGRIRPKIADYEPTLRENDALDYLFYEWDYEYSPKT